MLDDAEFAPLASVRKNEELLFAVQAIDKLAAVGTINQSIDRAFFEVFVCLLFFFLFFTGRYDGIPTQVQGSADIAEMQVPPDVVLEPITHYSNTTGTRQLNAWIEDIKQQKEVLVHPVSSEQDVSFCFLLCIQYINTIKFVCINFI